MADNNTLPTLKLILLLFLLAFTLVNSQISDKRLCADKECKVVISQARALGRHPGDHPLKLTFESGDIISIISKSAGKNPHLWGGEIKGHRGYFDKNFVKEIKVFVENPVHEVDTEGQMFENLRPPNIDRPRNRQPVLSNAIDKDGTNERTNEDSKVIHLVRPNIKSTNDKDIKDDDEKLQKADETKQNDIMDDLLQLDGISDDVWRNEKTGFSRTDRKKAVDDDENNEDINLYLKKVLLSGDREKDDDPSHDPKDNTLKVKPDIPEDDNHQKHHQAGDHHKPEQSGQSGDIRVMSAPSEIEEDHSNNYVKDNEDDHKSKLAKEEDKEHKHDGRSEDDKKDNGVKTDESSLPQSKNVEIEKDEKVSTDVEDSDFDPTEVEEFPASESDKGIKSGDKNTILNIVEENVIKTDAASSEYKLNTDDDNLKKSVTEDDVQGTKESSEGAKDTSIQEKEMKESVIDAHDKPSNSDNAQNIEKQVLLDDHKENSLLRNNESDIKKDKEDEKSKHIDNINDEIYRKTESLLLKEKEDSAHNQPEVTKAIKENLDKSQVIDSEVRPDTPSGTLSPESAQGVDPVFAEKVEAKPDTASESDKKIDDSNIDKLSGNNASAIELPDNNFSFSDKKPDKDDADKSSSDGLPELQSSRTEPGPLNKVTETPELKTNPASAYIDDKNSDSPANLNIESSKSDDYKQDVTNDEDKKGNKVVSLETLIEDGSAIVVDENGNIVTAFMIDDKATKDVRHHMHSSVASKKESELPIQPVSSTVVNSAPQPSVVVEEGKGLYENPLNRERDDGDLNKTHSKESDPKIKSLHEDNVVNEAYQSAEFNSRNLLSVNLQQSTSESHQQQQEQQTKPVSLEQQSPTPQQQPLEEKNKEDSVSVIPTSTQTFSSEDKSDLPDIFAKSSGSETVDSKDSASNVNQTDDVTHEEFKSLGKVDHSGHSNEDQSGETTQSTIDSMEIPPPTDIGESGSDANIPSGDYETQPVYHSRKITDEDLINEEDQKASEPRQGFFKQIVTNFERLAKGLFEMLPSSVQSVLEPFSSMPSIKVLIATFSLAMLVSTSLVSCCFSGGPSKKQQSVMLIKLDEMEKKQLIDLKEKQNLEDEIASKTLKNKQLKEEIDMLTEESKKSKAESHTVHLNNETMKKQLLSYQEKMNELKENANSKQGEAKQQSKKTKDLEAKVKKLEEREKNLEQSTQKLTLDLKHKEEEITLLTSKVTGLTDQVGHLQTSKDQLLAEAEDWKEKVSELKERLDQREEEFRQMQETIMFKESELEVLKDCFLQLKSFEEQGEEGESTEEANARVSEKISSLMDVSKINASLLALEEEKSSLANKLDIELEARRELEEQLESSRRSMESSTADKMKAERQCQEALTKLSVLSSYFKEKEMQLQKELGEQEVLKKQNQNKLVSADEATKTIQQELEFLRTQSESLKRELASSERDFRSQIAANEKKAHENWLAARAAERELKEAKHEAGVLRQKLTDLERRHPVDLGDFPDRRQFIGPGGLIRPLPTRGIPPAGLMNGPPPPPGMERSPSRGSMPPLPPHLREDEFMAFRGDRGPPPFPVDPRRVPPGHPPGMFPLSPDPRSPPPRVPPPFAGGRSPPLRMPPPPGMMDGRSPPPYDRRPPPPHMMDRRSPPFRHPPNDMLPPPMRGIPLPPPHIGRIGSGSPPLGLDSPRPDGRYPLPPYGRNPPPPSDRPLPKQNSQASPRQQQSQV